MPTEITISREPSTASSDAADFFDEVSTGSADVGDYPFIWKVTLDGTDYYGFTSGLPESREPWTAGFLSFTRDSVLVAETLQPADDDVATAVTALLDLFADRP